MKLHHFKLLLSSLLVGLPCATNALTLSEAIENAIKTDPILRSSKLNLLATEEGISIARARLLPQVSLQGTSSQLTQTTTQEVASGNPVNRSFTGPSINQQLVLRQAIIRPKEFSLLKYSELQVQYLSAKYKMDLADLKLRVVNVWIELIGAQQIVSLYEKPISLLKAASEQEIAKYVNGEGTKDAVKDSNAQYHNALAAHKNALEMLVVKQRAFEKLTGLTKETVKDLRLPLISHEIININEKNEFWTNFQNSSQELKMAELQAQMQLEKIKIAEADHKPTLDFLAALNYAQNDATSTQGYQYKNKQIGLQFTLPLYSGGGINAMVRQASLHYSASLADIEAINVKLENDFENTWGIIMGSSHRQYAFNSTWMAAEEQAKSIARAYELGVKTLSEYAASNLNSSRKNIDLIVANQDYLRNIYKINKEIIVNDFSINKSK